MPVREISVILDVIAIALNALDTFNKLGRNIVNIKIIPRRNNPFSGSTILVIALPFQYCIARANPSRLNCFAFSLILRLIDWILLEILYSLHLVEIFVKIEDFVGFSDFP